MKKMVVSPHTDADVDLLATDDLLPIYIRVVVQAAPGLLLANILYMSTFAPEDVLEGSMGFTLPL